MLLFIFILEIKKKYFYCEKTLINLSNKKVWFPDGWETELYQKFRNRNLISRESFQEGAGFEGIAPRISTPPEWMMLHFYEFAIYKYIPANLWSLSI